MAILTSDSGSFYNLRVSSSLAVTGSTFLTLNTTSSAANVVMVNPSTGQLYYTASSAVANTSVFPYTGSAIISGSLIVTGSTTSTLGFTGSLLGTASFVSGSVHGSTNPALSASYAATASFALSASYASGSTSASYAATSSIATSASFATTASFVISASFAQTATTASNIIATVPSAPNTSYYITFVTSSGTSPQPIYITGNLTYNNTTQALNATASWAVSASVATSSSYALSASYAATASIATSASYAATASFVLSSSYALTASYAPLAAQVQGGANNYIPLWTGSTQLTSSVMYQTGSNIGINKIPSTALDMIGTATITGSLKVQTAGTGTNLSGGFAITTGLTNVDYATYMKLGNYTIEALRTNEYHFNGYQSGLYLKGGQPYLAGTAPTFIWGNGYGPFNSSGLEIGVNSTGEYANADSYPSSSNNYYFINTRLVTPSPSTNQRRSLYIGAQEIKFWVSGSTNDNTFTSAPAMTITSGSNVGIGTTTSAYKLETSGSGISGSLNVDNTLYVSGGYVSVGTNNIGAGVTPTSNFGTNKEIYANGGFNVGNPNSLSYVKTGMYAGSSNDLKFWSGNSQIVTMTYVGGTGTSADSLKIAESYNASSGTGTVSALRIIGSTQPAGANSVNYNQIYITPAYSQSVGTGAIRGIYYNPSIQTLGSSTHTAIETTSGNIIFGGNNITASISGSLIVSGSSLTFDIPSKANNYVLKSDANGGATWANPSILAANIIASGSVSASIDVGTGSLTVTSGSKSLMQVVNDGSTRFSGSISIGDPALNGLGLKLVNNYGGGTITFSNDGLGSISLTAPNNTITFTGNYKFQSTPTGTSVATCAVLEASSTTRGFLPPRMTGAQAEAISTPLDGLMVFASSGNGSTITSTGWWGYSGSLWRKFNIT